MTLPTMSATPGADKLELTKGSCGHYFPPVPGAKTVYTSLEDFRSAPHRFVEAGRHPMLGTPTLIPVILCPDCERRVDELLAARARAALSTGQCD